MKHAVVTGGAKGIGLGVVRELIGDDWHCSILDADPVGQGVADELGGAEQSKVFGVLETVFQFCFQP